MRGLADWWVAATAATVLGSYAVVDVGAGAGAAGRVV
jgi:hypothetical protein